MMLSTGIARIEDINMYVHLPNRVYPSTGTPGGTEQRLFIQHDLVLDTAGSCVTLWNGNAYRRYRIDIRPADELAIECFFVIKEIDPSFYKTLVKQWIKDHCTSSTLRCSSCQTCLVLVSEDNSCLSDWVGFCEALHKALNAEFIFPGGPKAIVVSHEQR